MSEKTPLHNLSKLDVWLLARVLVGHAPLPSHLSKATPDVARLVTYLSGIAFPSRDLSIRQMLHADDYARVATLDTDAPCPMVNAQDDDFEIIDIKDLDKLKPLRWIIEGEIPESGLTMIFGESNVGKSFVALDYALRVADNFPVLYVLGEGVSGIRKRVYGWCQHHKKDYRRLKLKFLFGLVDLHDRGGTQKVIDALATFKPYMIVVDTLSLVTGDGDENSARDMNRLLRNCLLILREYETTIVFVHHTGKEGDKERGSTALRGRIDTMIQIVPADDLIAIESAKSRDEKRFETRYVKLLPVQVEGHGDTLVPVPSQLVLRDDSGPMSPNQRQILDVMALEVYADGIPLRELSEATRLSIRQVQSALSNLLRKGHVEKNRSYRITNKGREALGLLPVDESVESDLNRAVSPHESLNRLNRLNHEKMQNGKNGDSSDSSDSPIHTGEQGDSSDSPIQLTWDEMMEQTKARKRNQYDW